jgi:hypothetical protein
MHSPVSTHTCKHAHTHSHTHTQARTHTHSHSHKHTHTHCSSSSSSSSNATAQSGSPTCSRIFPSTACLCPNSLPWPLLGCPFKETWLQQSCSCCCARCRPQGRSSCRSYVAQSVRTMGRYGAKGRQGVCKKAFARYRSQGCCGLCTA